MREFLLSYIHQDSPPVIPYRNLLPRSTHASTTDDKMSTSLRSSKSALHGLIHWLASRYATTGITVNGIAPALISDTKMLPGQNEELAKSENPLPRSELLALSEVQVSANELILVCRNPHRPSRHAGRDRGNIGLDGEDGVRDEQGGGRGRRDVCAMKSLKGVSVDGYLDNT